MNDYDEIWQIKRGRPRKLMLDDCLKLNASIKKSLPPNECAYRAAKNQYMKETYSISTENLIRMTLSLAVLPAKDKHLPLFIIVKEGVSQMLASDMEVVVFSVIFLSRNLADLTISLEEFIKICIFLAKLQIESDLELVAMIKNHLEEEISDFTNKVNYFDTGIKITTRDIIRWSKRLSNSHESCINYSYYVDEILLKAPPYKVTEKFDQNEKINKKIKINKKQKLFTNINEVPSDEEIESVVTNPIEKSEANENIEVEVVPNSLDDREVYWWLEKDEEYGLENLE